MTDENIPKEPGTLAGLYGYDGPTDQFVLPGEPKIDSKDPERPLPSSAFRVIAMTLLYDFALWWNDHKDEDQQGIHIDDVKAYVGAKKLDE